ncbi:MAG: patatin-like phospholipase family protein [Spirochaetaceae bacterium]|jgi:NTE family protein|nr:patatin-like phospholipase family protein [Spirochaetaceae bacterium]
MNQESYCLVLSGGGAKGVYHIGVWRALQELDIKVDAFVGNSIGAIVAGFLAQGQYEELENLGKNIGLDFLLNIPESMMDQGELKITKGGFGDFERLIKNGFSTKGGLDTTPLRELLEENLDEQQIRKNGKDFGVVTYSISDMKSREVYVEQMEKGELLSYILASSAFPGFETPEIAGKKYIDGGVYDNIPYAMARQRGYKRIIVVDISGIGMTRKLRIQGGTTVYIKNSQNMGGVLDFNREFIQKYTELGYLDTLRIFGKLEGYKYFFNPDNALEEPLQQMMLSSDKQKALIDLAQNMLGRRQEDFITALRNLMPEDGKYDKKWHAAFYDSAAEILGLESIKQWNYTNLFFAMKEQKTFIQEDVASLKDIKLLELEARIRKEFKEKNLKKPGYHYYLLILQFLPKGLHEMFFKTLGDFFPSLALGVFVLEYLEELWDR